MQNADAINENEGDNLAAIVPTEDNKHLDAAAMGQLFEDSEDEDQDKKGKKQSRNYLKDIEFEHPEIASYSELFWQFFFMPVAIYAGLGRLVVTTDHKTTVG